MMERKIIGLGLGDLFSIPGPAINKLGDLGQVTLSPFSLYKMSLDSDSQFLHLRTHQNHLLKWIPRGLGSRSGVALRYMYSYMTMNLKRPLETQMVKKNSIVARDYNKKQPFPPLVCFLQATTFNHAFDLMVTILLLNNKLALV